MYCQNLRKVSQFYTTLTISFQKILVLSRVHATLQDAMPVYWSVGWSISRLICQFVS